MSELQFLPKGLQRMTLRAVPLPATVTAAILVAACGFCLSINWPGHLSYDSVIQLLEGRTAIYANWHPPVMSWLLGLGDAVLPGAGLFMAADTVLIFGSLIGLVMLARRPGWIGAAVAVLLIATPQLLTYPALVWKDVLFAATTLAGFAALAGAGALWPRPALRAALLAAALVLLTVAALARQNGLLVLVFAALALGGMAARSGWFRATLWGGGGLAVALALVAAGHAGLALRVEGESGPGAQLRLLEVYDMIGALHADPRLDLPLLQTGDPELLGLMRSDGVRLYSPERNDTLGKSEALSDAIGDANPSLVARQWRALMLSHPALYLATRWAAFDRVFATPDLAACLPFYFGVDGPVPTMRALGIARRWDGRDAALDRYARHFMGTPVMSHPFWAVVAGVALVLLLIRRRPADLALAGLMAAVLAFAASFFVISIACDYRYLYALDLSAMAALLYLAADPAGLIPPVGRRLWLVYGRGRASP